MRKLISFAALALFIGAIPVQAQDDTAAKADKLCTDAHMAKMDEMVADMSGDEKQEAMKHLEMSKEAMMSGDMAGCVKHMEMAHDAMGM